MSQFPKPIELFNGSTNWTQAQAYVDSMISYLTSEGGCCSGTKLPCYISFMYYAMLIDSPQQQNNTSRWHNDIEALYRTLYPLT